MFTLFIIIIVIVVVIASNKKDKRPKDADEKIKELPPIHYKVPAKDKTGRFWSGELFEFDGCILDEFEYNSGLLTLKMRDGKRLVGLLSDAVVKFNKSSDGTTFNVKLDKKEVEFCKLDTFTKEEWEVIINVLLLAGTTYGKGIFGKTYKNISRSALIMKIISKL